MLPFHIFTVQALPLTRRGFLRRSTVVLGSAKWAADRPTNPLGLSCHMHAARTSLFATPFYHYYVPDGVLFLYSNTSIIVSTLLASTRVVCCNLYCIIHYSIPVRTTIPLLYSFRPSSSFFVVLAATKVAAQAPQSTDQHNQHCWCVHG